MKITFLFLPFSFLIFSCSQKENITIEFTGQDSTMPSTISINNIIDKQSLASFSVADSTKSSFQIPITTFQYAELRADTSPPLLLVIEPGEVNQIKWVTKKKQFVAQDPASRLLNYLWQSNNDFIKDHTKDIYQTDQPEQLVDLFQGLIDERKGEIDKNKAQLSDLGYRFLVNQNINRAYAYLFYYGKVIKDLPVEHTYFRFLDQLDINDTLNYYMGKNILYRLEMKYAIQNKTIQSPQHFFEFIHDSTPESHPVSFYQALYLKELLLKISYWKNHIPLLTPEMLHNMIRSYEANFPQSRFNHFFQPLAKEYRLAD